MRISLEQRATSVRREYTAALALSRATGIRLVLVTAGALEMERVIAVRAGRERGVKMRQIGLLVCMGAPQGRARGEPTAVGMADALETAPAVAAPLGRGLLVTRALTGSLELTAR